MEARERLCDFGVPVRLDDRRMQLMSAGVLDAGGTGDFIAVLDAQLDRLEEGREDSRGRLRRDPKRKLRLVRPAPDDLDLREAPTQGLRHAILTQLRAVASAAWVGDEYEDNDPALHLYPRLLELFEERADRAHQQQRVGRWLSKTRAAKRGQIGMALRVQPPRGQPDFIERQSDSSAGRAWLSDYLYRVTQGERRPQPTIIPAHAWALANTVTAVTTAPELIELVWKTLEAHTKDRRTATVLVRKLALAAERMRLPHVGAQRRDERGQGWRMRLTRCAGDRRAQSTLAVGLALVVMMPADGGDMGGLTIGQLTRLTRAAHGRHYGETITRLMLSMLVRVQLIQRWQPSCDEVDPFAIGATGNTTNAYRLNTDPDRQFRGFLKQVAGELSAADNAGPLFVARPEDVARALAELQQRRRRPPD